MRWLNLVGPSFQADALALPEEWTRLRLTRPDWETRFLEMCSGGDTRLVARLLDAGAPVNWRGSDERLGWTPLMCAAAGGYRGIGRLLLNRGARLDAKDHDGNSALVWAIWNGKIEMARMLLDFGAELEAKRHDGCTPVMVAASCGMADAVSMLVVRGADLDATAFDGEDAVQICTDERCKQLLCSARRGRRWRRRRALVTWRH